MMFVNDMCYLFSFFFFWSTDRDFKQSSDVMLVLCNFFFRNTFKKKKNQFKIFLIGHEIQLCVNSLSISITRFVIPCCLIYHLFIGCLD